MFSHMHNPIFALFSSVAIQREQRKNQEQGNIYKGLSVRSCAESVCAVCVCEMFVWLLVHASTNFYGGCVRCVRWNNVRPNCIANDEKRAKIGLWLNMRSVCCVFLGREQKKKVSKSVKKVALTITGAGVVARKLTFSNKVSELLDGDPPAPRWLFHYITVTSHVAGLSRTVIVSRSYRWHSQTKLKARDEPNIQNVPTTSKV